MDMTRTLTRITVPVLLALTLVACGGGGGDDGDDGVASLDEGDSTATTDDDGSGRGGGPRLDAEFQDAMLEYAACMREQGIDFPDPSTSGEGLVVVGGPGSEGEADREEFEAADEACQPILEEVEGSRPQPSPEEMAEMQDEALRFAECMREHGVDMPDPVFEEDGRMTQAIGGDEGPGIDPSSDEFQEAEEECGGEGGIIGGRGPGGPERGVAGGSEDD
jgi:hypothetical protein